MKLISWILISSLFYCQITRIVWAQSDITGDQGFTFDDTLLRGNDLGMGHISRFNTENSVDPGKYLVDLYVNNKFILRVTLRFIQKDHKIHACFLKQQLLSLSVKPSAIKDVSPDDPCLSITNVLPGSSSRFSSGQLRLDLSIPQHLMNSLPRGYIDPHNLDRGSTIGFINYNANQYHVSSHNGNQRQRIDSAYVGLLGGLNMGLWQFRQQGAFRHDSLGNRWDSTRRYIQRALPNIRSEMTLGETFTGGQFFSSMGYRGISLATDDRMLPDSMQGYAPIVRGIAKSNARVTVYQNKRSIYQTTVPPGAFQLNDLTATQYGGDLTVDITEADGSVSTFQVPFATVPDSLRPGLNRYALSLGKVRDVGGNNTFGEFTFQRGVNNAITANSGLRIANGYQALMLGGVLTNLIGAFGFDTTYSSASLPENQKQNGWMMRLSFNHTFQPTDTTIALAGYRYSTQGYRDLSDVLTLRAERENQTGYSSNNYMQRSRIEVSLNQGLNDYGSVYLSASSQNYRDGRSSDEQLQFGYSTVLWRNVSLNLSVSRQRTSTSNASSYHTTDSTLQNWNSSVNSQSVKETLSQISLSFPLGGHPDAPYVSASVTNSKNTGASYQTSLSGVAGEAQDLSYGVDFTRQQRSNENTLSASMQKRLPLASLSGTVSRGRNYWQGSVSARGAIAAHSGGVTLGPYLSDTFALVEAKGATGAKVMYGQGASIDRFGYALVPTLTPYRYNTITLDPQGMAQNTELQDAQRRVAPFAGSAVKITFRTLTGYPVLIKTELPDGDVVPMGADVHNSKGAIVGMVGQAGQAYLRAETLTGRLSIVWGDSNSERCTLNYDLGHPAKDQPIINIRALCTPG